MPYTKDQIISLLRECKRDPQIFCSIDYWDRKIKNPYEWKVVYKGPKNSPYEGGIFTVKVNIPLNYPDSKPQFYFQTRIYHLNIYCIDSKSDGHVCFGDEKTNDIKELIKIVDRFFSFQNPGSTWYPPEVQQEYKDYRDGKSKTFYEKAQNWVYLYAGVNQLKQ